MHCSADNSIKFVDNDVLKRKGNQAVWFVCDLTYLSKPYLCDFMKTVKFLTTLSAC